MTSERVLIVEDETKLLEHLSRTLSDAGFPNFTCSSYRDLERMLELPVKRFDLVLLDRLLHGRDSVELILPIKRILPEAQIMILSAINTAAEKTTLLNMGADDYLSKPFDSNELIARIRALLRRNKIELKLGNIVLNLSERTLWVQGAEMTLTNKEFALLRTLAQTPGKIFNKTFLYEQVWEMSVDVESNVVEATINKLRKRLVESGANVHIKNTRNIGYWIEE